MSALISKPQKRIWGRFDPFLFLSSSENVTKKWASIHPKLFGPFLLLDTKSAWKQMPSTSLWHRCPQMANLVMMLGDAIYYRRNRIKSF